MNIVIWGRGKLSEDILKVIYSTKNDIEVSAFVDNGPIKEGQKVLDKIIISLDELKEKFKSQEIRYILVPAYPNLAQILRIKEELEITLDNIYIIDSKSLYELINKYGSFVEMIQQRRNKIPFISSLEYEVAHHCNLNCKGCNHFSPLQRNEVFGNLESFIKDLMRISELIEYIGVIKLLGGEPLLNPQLCDLVKAANKIFPNASIHIITNGILIRHMRVELIEILRRLDIVISFSVYPPMKKNFTKIEEFMIDNNLRYEIFNDAKKFCSQINSEGDSDPVKAELNCGSAYCHIFEDGKIAKCALTHKIPVYNKAFNTYLPQCDIDLYDKDINPMKLFEYLTRPIAMCCYCGYPKWYSWQCAQSVPGQDEYECRFRYI